MAQTPTNSSLLLLIVGPVNSLRHMALIQLLIDSNINTLLSPAKFHSSCFSPNYFDIGRIKETDWNLSFACSQQKGRLFDWDFWHEKTKKTLRTQSAGKLEKFSCMKLWKQLSL